MAIDQPNTGIDTSLPHDSPRTQHTCGRLVLMRGDEASSPDDFTLFLVSVGGFSRFTIDLRLIGGNTSDTTRKRLEGSQSQLERAASCQVSTSRPAASPLPSDSY